MTKRLLEESEYFVKPNGDIVFLLGKNIKLAEVALITSTVNNTTYFNFASTIYTASLSDNIMTINNNNKPISGEDLKIIIIENSSPAPGIVQKNSNIFSNNAFKNTI